MATAGTEASARRFFPEARRGWGGARCLARGGGGRAEPGVGSQGLSATAREGGGVILGPPHTPLRYTHPRQSPSGSPSSKMAPPVGSRFYDESSGGSSSPRPRDQVNAGLVGSAFPAEVFLVNSVFHNAARRGAARIGAAAPRRPRAGARLPRPQDAAGPSGSLSNRKGRSAPARHRGFPGGPASKLGGCRCRAWPVAGRPGLAVPPGLRGPRCGERSQATLIASCSPELRTG